MVKNTALTDEKLLNDVAKAQFFHDCISASLKKEPPLGCAAYEVDWDVFGKYFTAYEKVSVNNRLSFFKRFYRYFSYRSWRNKNG